MKTRRRRWWGRPNGKEAGRREENKKRTREVETNERGNENRIKIVSERNPHFSFQPGRLDAWRSDNQT